MSTIEVPRVASVSPLFSEPAAPKPRASAPIRSVRSVHSVHPARTAAQAAPTAQAAPASSATPGISPDQAPVRGEIWFVSSRSTDPECGSHRSVGREIWSNKLAVVISNDSINTRSGVAQIVYLTASGRKRESRVHIPVTLPGAEGETATAMTALCEQVHPVDQSRLAERRGVCSDEELESIERAVRWSLGLLRRSA